MSNFESPKGSKNQAALSPLLIAALMQHFKPAELESPESSIPAAPDVTLMPDRETDPSFASVYDVAKGDHA